MAVSPRFLELLRFQLAQFADCRGLRSVVVYVAQPGAGATPDLVPVGRWPLDQTLALPTVAADRRLQDLAGERRWLPLQHQQLLLGAMQVEAEPVPWPEPLQQRLQAVALCLTEALCLDLEQQRLQRELQRRGEQQRLLLHQLRNPLAALRTFGQLLRRRLEHDPGNRSLVEGLLTEERQLGRYVEALGQLDGPLEPPALPPAASGQTAAPDQPTASGQTTASGLTASSRQAGAGLTPLLLPPLPGPLPHQPAELTTVLAPLLQRAAATAALQGRPWCPPGSLPDWPGQARPEPEAEPEPEPETERTQTGPTGGNLTAGGRREGRRSEPGRHELGCAEPGCPETNRGEGLAEAVGEIVANLLENAFRYSPAGVAVGLAWQSEPDGGLSLTVWDEGPPIPPAERQAIFERGVRGSAGQELPGSGLGLALGRDLARSLGGELSLLATADEPGHGNAFRLRLPPIPPSGSPSQRPGPAPEAS